MVAFFKLTLQRLFMCFMLSRIQGCSTVASLRCIRGFADTFVFAVSQNRLSFLGVSEVISHCLDLNFWLLLTGIKNQT